MKRDHNTPEHKLDAAAMCLPSLRFAYVDRKRKANSAAQGKPSIMLQNGEKEINPYIRVERLFA